MLNIIPTKIHGILDYLVGLLLIMLPTFLGFSSHGPENKVMVVSGIVTIIYSLLTRYEWSLGKFISMRVHLWLDLASGILLAVAPWLFGFVDRVYFPYFLMGVLELMVVVLSDSRASTGKSAGMETWIQADQLQKDD